MPQTHSTGMTASAPSVTQTERSRWPGVEARIAFQHGESGIGTEVGVGGYFSPHRAGDGNTSTHGLNSGFEMPLSRYFELTVNGYRGQALAGLGGGGYVNYYDLYEGSEEYAHGLDDAGGWAQLKARPATRLEINAGSALTTHSQRRFKQRWHPLEVRITRAGTQSRCLFECHLQSKRISTFLRRIQAALDKLQFGSNRFHRRDWNWGGYRF